MTKRGPKKRIPPTPAGVGPLKSSNVVIDGHRTSMRLEPHMWEALEEIAVRERMTVHDICSEIRRRMVLRAELSGVELNPAEVTLTAAVRTFMVSYFRNAVTDVGHRLAGHGDGDPFAGTPFDLPNDLKRGTPPSDDGAPPSSENGSRAKTTRVLAGAHTAD